MKKYVVLAGGYYYPMARLGDIVGGFDTIEEAQNPENLKSKYPDGSWGVHDWACIVDRDSWEILYEWETEDYKSNEYKLSIKWVEVKAEREK